MSRLSGRRYVKQHEGGSDKVSAKVNEDGKGGGVSVIAIGGKGGSDSVNENGDTGGSDSANANGGKGGSDSVNKNGDTGGSDSANAMGTSGERHSAYAMGEADERAGARGLQAIDLGFRYGRSAEWVLRGLSLSIEPGELVGLRGASGSGKSTLARLLAGHVQPTEGAIRSDGAALPSVGVYCPVQLVLQQPDTAVNPRWRIGRILEEGGPLQPELLEALGIDAAWHSRWPGELSGGELQRVCIARALAGPVRYLIADEMTALLDPLTQAQIWQAVLQAARARGIGLLVISHDQALLNRVCSRQLPWP